MKIDKLITLGRTTHNTIDLIRDIHRKQQTRGGIVVDSHNPIKHFRNQLTLKPRGGDSRTVVPNRNEQIRRIRANDLLTKDRPLG